MTIRCYKYNPSETPFLEFEVKTAGDMIHELSEKISWRDFPNDIWVKIGSDLCILYDPLLDQFKDYNGVRWVNIPRKNLCYYYFT